MSKQEIVDSYVFVTAGACGPCRFGMYEAEYRLALRNAGFDGFRVLLFQQSGGLNQAGEADGMELNARLLPGLHQRPEHAATCSTRSATRCAPSRSSPARPTRRWTEAMETLHDVFAVQAQPTCSRAGWAPS